MSFSIYVCLWIVKFSLNHAISCSLPLQIFVSWVSKPSLLFKLIPKSFLLLLFLMTSLSILIETGSSVLKMKWHLSAFAFKKYIQIWAKTGVNFDSFFHSCQIIKYQVECIHTKVQCMEFCYRKVMCYTRHSPVNSRFYHYGFLF